MHLEKKRISKAMNNKKGQATSVSNHTAPLMFILTKDRQNVVLQPEIADEDDLGDKSEEQNDDVDAINFSASKRNTASERDHDIIENDFNVDSKISALRIAFTSHLKSKYGIECVDSFNDCVLSDLGIYSKNLSHLQHYFHYTDPATDEKISEFLYGKHFDVSQIALIYLISTEALSSWVQREMYLEEDEEDEIDEFKIANMKNVMNINSSDNNRHDFHDDNDIVMGADMTTVENLFTISTKELKNLVTKQKVMDAICEENDFLRMYKKLKNSTSRKGRQGTRNIGRLEFKNWFMQTIQKEED